MTNVTAKNEFRCDCQNFYYGQNCQFKIDICADKLCSSNGRCFDNSSVPTCSCFKYFSGENCEIKSETLKVMKTTSKNMANVAITVLCLFYISIVVMDLSKLIAFIRAF